MAYNLIPKNLHDVIVIKTSKPQISEDLVKAYSYVIKKVPSSEAQGPFSMDPKAPQKIKVLRQLNGPIKLQDLKSQFKSLSFAWGNGSRGNLGTNNRGNLFEGELIDDINRYIADSEDPKIEHRGFVMGLFQKYGLENKSGLHVKAMGALNQRRPMGVSGNQPYIGSLNDHDVGKTVTDVDVIHDKGVVHMSLKFGPTVTFFNIGVAKMIPQAEIKQGIITNPQGKILLDMVGVDNARFCSTFNSYGGRQATRGGFEDINVTSKIDKRRLQKFLKTGIGYGFHLVHKDRGHIHSFPMTPAMLERFTTIQDVVVRYPNPGAAKKVSVFIKTPELLINLNFRNKVGGSYPNMIMADYRFRKN